MSKKKKKKNKKKRLMRLRELQGLEQSVPKEETPLSSEFQSENEEVKVGTKPLKEEPSSKEKEPENKVFEKDLRRIGIVILVCILILIGLMFVFQHTNFSSSFNFLLLR